MTSGAKKIDPPESVATESAKKNRGPLFNTGAIIGLVMALVLIGLDVFFSIRSPVGFRIGVFAARTFAFLFFFTGMGQVIWRALYYPVLKNGGDEELGTDLNVNVVPGKSDYGPKLDDNVLNTLTSTGTTGAESIRLRAWILGAFFVALLGFATPYIEMYLCGTDIALNHMPYAPLFISFFLVMVVNGLLAGAWNIPFFRRIFGMNRTDLLTIFAMTLCTAGIPVYYLMAYVIPTNVAGRFFQEKGFVDTVLVYLPDEKNPDGWFQLTPRDPEMPVKYDYVDVEKWREQVGGDFFGDTGKLPARELKRLGEIEKKSEDIKPKGSAAERPMSEKKRISLLRRGKVGAVVDWENIQRQIITQAMIPKMTGGEFLTEEYSNALLQWRMNGSEGSAPDRRLYVNLEDYLHKLVQWSDFSDPAIQMLAAESGESDYRRSLVYAWRMMGVSSDAVEEKALPVVIKDLRGYAEHNKRSNGSWVSLYGDSGIAPPVPLGDSADAGAFPAAYINENGAKAVRYVKKHAVELSVPPVTAGKLTGSQALALMIHHWTEKHRDDLYARLPQSILPPKGEVRPWFDHRKYVEDYAKYLVAPRPVEWAYSGVPKGEKRSSYIDENGKEVVLSRTYAAEVQGHPEKKNLYWTKLPWAGWLKPGITWGIFIFAMWALMVSICALLRKQWDERERLTFPLAQVPLDMTEGIVPGGIGSWFTQRLTLIGIAIPVLYHSWNMIPDFRRNWPKIPMVNRYVGEKYFTEPPWNRIGRIDVSFFPVVIALTYLVSLEVSFSIWFFWVVEKTTGMLLAGAGYGKSVDSFVGYNEGGWLTTFTDQGVGALIAMVLFGLFMARGHLKNVVRKAVLGKKCADVDDSTEPLTYRTGLLMFFISYVVLVLWVTKAGMPFQWGLLFITLFIIFLTGITRLVAEGGFFFIQAEVAPYHMIDGLVTPARLGAEGITAMGMVHASIMFDLRCMPMPSIMNSMKFAGDAGIKRRHITAAIMFALGFMTICSFFGFTGLAYREGMSMLENGGGWTLIAHPVDVYNKMKSDNEKIEQYHFLKKEYKKNLNKWEKDSQAPEYIAGKKIAEEAVVNPAILNNISAEETKSLDAYKSVGDKPQGLSDSQKQPAKFGLGRLVSYLLGATVMILFLVMRQRIFWWPHPIGYIAWMAPDAMNKIVMSVFLGWFLKWALVKYGGMKTYFKMRRFFIGLVVGEAVIAIVWIAVKWYLGMQGGHAIGAT